jgi:hypothetical protein
MPRTALMVTNHPEGTSTLAWEPVDGRSLGRDIVAQQVIHLPQGLKYMGGSPKRTEQESKLGFSEKSQRS